MKYDFDKVIDRRNTYSIKYDCATDRGKTDDLCPLWVADMDFKTSEEVINRIKDRVDHGIWGYSDPNETYYSAIKSFFLKNHKLSIDTSDIVTAPGVVFFMNCAIRALTEEDDGIIVQKPVYYPFFHGITNNKRKVINSSLINNNGLYEMDFEDFEDKIIKNNVKLFVLCSPHNPVGRVWKYEELLTIGEICKKHNVFVISDEVHCDFAFERKHLPFWNIRDDFKEFSAICTSPSKTFNLAGVQNANIFLANKDVKKKIKQEIGITGYSNIGIFSLIGAESAYRYGMDWLVQVKKYLKDNISFVENYISTNIPSIKVVNTEASYLMWIDFRNLNLSQDDLDTLITEKAKLWLNSGTIFGEEGIGYQRINIATQRSVLEDALKNLKEAIISL